MDWSYIEQRSLGDTVPTKKTNALSTCDLDEGNQHAC